MGESARDIGLPTGCPTSLSAKRETLPAAPESPAPGHARIALPGKQKKRVFLAALLLYLGCLLRNRVITGLRNDAGALRQPQHVKNERHLAIHDGCARIGFQALQMFA